MTARPKQTIAARLNAAQVAISNSLSHAEIKEAVGNLGFSESRLQDGEVLYQTGLKAVDDKMAADGFSRQAGAQTAAAKETAVAAYQALMQVARAALGDDHAQLTALGVGGRTPHSTAAFLRAAYSLFDNAANIPEIQTALAGFQFDTARLKAERAKIEAFDHANQSKTAARAVAQQATRDRDAAMTALDDWVSAYLRVAKVALRGKRELLEALGIAVRSTKTAAQRAAPQKAAATRKAKKTNNG